MLAVKEVETVIEVKVKMEKEKRQKFPCGLSIKQWKSVTFTLFNLLYLQVNELYSLATKRRKLLLHWQRGKIFIFPSTTTTNAATSSISLWKK